MVGNLDNGFENNDPDEGSDDSEDGLYIDEGTDINGRKISICYNDNRIYGIDERIDLGNQSLFNVQFSFCDISNSFEVSFYGGLCNGMSPWIASYNPTDGYSLCLNRESVDFFDPYNAYVLCWEDVNHEKMSKEYYQRLTDRIIFGVMNFFFSQEVFNVDYDKYMNKTERLLREHKSEHLEAKLRDMKEKVKNNPHPLSGVFSEEMRNK